MLEEFRVSLLLQNASIPTPYFLHKKCYLFEFHLHYVSKTMARHVSKSQFSQNMKSNLRFCNEYSIRLIGLLMCIHSGSTISPFTIPARFLQSLDRLLLCSIEFFFKSIIMF